MRRASAGTPERERELLRHGEWMPKEEVSRFLGAFVNLTIWQDYQSPRTTVTWKLHTEAPLEDVETGLSDYLVSDYTSPGDQEVDLVEVDAKALGH